jgi:hypothetical protein
MAEVNGREEKRQVVIRWKTALNIINICLAVTHGGLVVSVLATGPKVRKFKPGRG